MNKLIRMSYNGHGSVREYILQGIDTSCKLKEMKVEIDNSFLSLYNNQKEKWTLDELISKCVQEESKIKK
ncbi:hypothetical protein OSB04_007238 [Centaurea solstitialis]|uniref:Uncharacterized protein n=1 Tax=Centaurea solstitialis TaxID=347529 RepID=A0AA38TJG8_9ASTR|nr:hypothetical protein OSB04_007238 [Centaurea solstitialis]